MKEHEIIDNAYSAADRERMFNFVKRSLYKIGWDDNNWDDVVGQQRILYSDYSEEDVEKIGVLNCHNSPRITELINGRKPNKVVINLAEPANTFMPHTHPSNEVFLYYCNPRWNTEWAGETLVYSQHESEAEYAISYRPGRVLWLNKGVMHSVRPPSNACPEYRFTLAAFFED